MLTTFVVTSVLDTIAPDGETTLREAIIAANGNAGLDNIDFNIGGGGVQTIQPTSALPTITDSVIIDGTTQPGFGGTPIIELDGNLAGNVNGLNITSGNGSTIRGLVINDFNRNALLITGGDNHTIEDNFLGTNVAGTATEGNGIDGIDIRTDNNLIQNNVISGNADDGIELDTATNTQVFGNFIGTDLTGTIDLGNLSDGILANRSSGNQIGGTGIGQANTIAGNNDDGIEITGNASFNNVIQANFIGTNSAGSTTIGNSDDGIVIGGSSDNNTIGGTLANEGNTIAQNGGTGITISSGNGHEIRANSIHTNGGIGIDLIGGANNSQSAPVVTSAFNTAGGLQITGTLASVALTSFDIEFFSNAIAAAEGEIFLGSTTVVTDGAGNAAFVVTFAAVPVGRFISATATNTTSDDTSEFAASALIPNSPPVINNQSFSIDENSPNGTPVATPVANEFDPGQSLTYSITGGSGSTAFGINAGSGLISVIDTTQLDFETTTSFTLTVQITDDGAPVLSDTATITIDINDLNEAPTAINDVVTVVEDTTLTVSPSGVYQATVLADSPTAYWRLGEAAGITAANLGSLGAAVDGTYIGSPTLGSNGQITNDVDTAVTFDGATQQVNIPDAAGLNLGGPFAAKTIELWFNASDVTTRQVLYEQGGGVRGLNVYVRNGLLFVGGWNINNDDGGLTTPWDLTEGSNSGLYTSTAVQAIALTMLFWS